MSDRPMTYQAWIKAAPIEDIIGGSVPHQAEIDKMTYADIKEKFGQTIVVDGGHTVNSL